MDKDNKTYIFINIKILLKLRYFLNDYIELKAIFTSLKRNLDFININRFNRDNDFNDFRSTKVYSLLNFLLVLIT